MIRNDIYWKGLIEDLFPYFIPFFLPQYATLFDLTRPVEFLDKELQQLYPEPGNDTETRFVDKLVKVFATSGEEKWVLIHIEVQGYGDKNFARRMYQYFYRIFDRYGIPVTAIAIFTDAHPAFLTNQYINEFAGTEMVYRFNTYKVRQQNETTLRNSDNPFAIAILTVLLALRSKKLDDGNLLHLKTALAREMYAKGFSAAITRQLFNFIKLYVNFAKPETAFIFDKAIEKITNNTKPMGLEEQVLEMKKQEGRQEGSSFFVENLLRSTDFTDERIASLAGVSLEFVRQTRKKLHL